MNNDQPPSPSSSIIHNGVWYVRYVPAVEAPIVGSSGSPVSPVSPVYSWLQRAAKCGITNVADAAYVLMAYYQGAEFPEPINKE